MSHEKRENDDKRICINVRNIRGRRKKSMENRF